MLPPDPVVVIMGPRLRGGALEREMLEYFVSSLNPLQTPVTFRVSGMISGPEEIIERVAPIWGHRVEIWGPDGTPGTRARRLSKNDNHERDASSLVGAHSLWVWLMESELHPHSKALDYEMITIAEDLGVPVFLFLPESSDFEVVRLQ